MNINHNKILAFSEFQQLNEPIDEYMIKPELSPFYKVYIDDVEVPVYTCRISKYPYNRAWSGYQRQINQTEIASYVNLTSNCDVNIRVVVNKTFEKIMIKPYSKNVPFNVERDAVDISLTENGQYVLEADDYHNPLYIFNNKPMCCAAPDEVTYYFGPGIHFAGKITLNSNESVYIDKDAYVYGWIYAENASNVHIYGNGVLDSMGEERFGKRFMHANGNIRLVKCKDVLIEEISVINSAIWCFSMFECENITADGLKIFGQWKYNSDGIDIVNSSNVTVRNSLVHSFDDAITIKGLIKHAHKNNEHILIKNTTIWCDWGRACEIGIETKCDEYNDIAFVDCDVVRGGCVALEVNNGNYAHVHNVRFENIRVEYESFYTPEVLQISEDEEYNAIGQYADTTLISVTNPDLASIIRVPKSEYELSMGNGTVSDVIFKDIVVYYDSALPLVNGKYDLKIDVKTIDNSIVYDNIAIENIVVNGKKLAESDMLLSGNNISSINIK